MCVNSCTITKSISRSGSLINCEFKHILPVVEQLPQRDRISLMSTYLYSSPNRFAHIAKRPGKYSAASRLYAAPTAFLTNS